MANKYFDNIVKHYPDPADRLAGSRYHHCDRIRDDEGDEYLESYEGLSFPERPDDRYHQVEPGEVNRLDLISYKYYGTPLLYWVIAEASGLDDPQEISAGATLRIPSRAAIYGYKGVLR